MTRTRYGSWLLGVVLLSLLASSQTFAISPSYIVFYGDGFSAPVVLKLDFQVSTECLWGTFRQRDGALPRETLAKRLEGRKYVKFAVFWGRWPEGVTKPEQASQHGRLYLPTASEPAAVVSSFPAMVGDDPTAPHPPAQPIPADLEESRDAQGHALGFLAGWTLSAQDLATLRNLGVPGF